MEKREEEKDKNRNRIIAILLLLIIFLCVYIYIGGMWTSQEEDTMESTPTELTDDMDRDSDMDSNDESKEIIEDAVEQEEKEDLVEDGTIEEEFEDDSEQSDLNEEVEGEEENSDTDVESTVKFGLTFSQRSDIWWKYQKRQGEIIKEAQEKNENKFSKVYIKYIDSEIKKLRYKLQTDYKINQGQLDYILQEGKDGKFNDAVQSF